MFTRGKVPYDYGFSGKKSKRIIHIQKGLKGASEQEAEELWESIIVIRILVTKNNGRKFYKFPLRPLQNMKLMFT